MATIAGVIKGITNISGNPLYTSNGRKVFLLSCAFPAYTGSTDDATVTGVGAAISACCDNGKTYTLRSAINGIAGIDTNGQIVYTGALTVSTDALTFNLAIAAGTEITATTPSTGVGIFVAVDES